MIWSHVDDVVICGTEEFRSGLTVFKNTYFWRTYQKVNRQEKMKLNILFIASQESFYREIITGIFKMHGYLQRHDRVPRTADGQGGPYSTT